MEKKNQVLTPRTIVIDDLSRRIIYGVRGHVINENGEFKDSYIFFDTLNEFKYAFTEITPYLRSIDKMTEKEKEEYTILLKKYRHEPFYEKYRIFDFLDSHMIDYRGLIKQGLALEAPDNMYNYG